MKVTHNGKELQLLANTTLIDYGARQYNPTLARWTAQDPMAEKYYGISPYMYCAGNPIVMVDVNGEDIVLWLIMARILEKSSKNHKIKEIGYAIQHPTKAARVSSYKKGTYNISTIATNFQINAINSAGLDQWGEGDYGNAFRHTLWQGLISRDLGARHAQRIGNAHEDGNEYSTDKRVFQTLAEADRVVDLLNNKIGREIGERNKSASNKTMAKLVATEFFQNGLWIVSNNRDDNIVIQKTRITKTKYQKMIEEIDKKGENGLNESQDE